MFQIALIIIGLFIWAVLAAAAKDGSTPALILFVVSTIIVLACEPVRSWRSRRRQQADFEARVRDALRGRSMQTVVAASPYEITPERGTFLIADTRSQRVVASANSQAEAELWIAEQDQVPTS